MNKPFQKIILSGLLPALLLLISSTAASAQSQTVEACHDIGNLNLADAAITTAEVIAAGEFRTPRPNAGNDSSTADAEAERRDRIYQGLPAFCRVAVTLTPSADSDIKMEIWLPASSWNGKYIGVGNGAFTGSIRYTSMINPLSRGYATSSTDTGHLGNTASFGLDHPEKVIDFGWRAVHEMTLASKAIAASYYREGPRYSYWSGCSAGGRQAMQEAQRFPGDYDGIIAGAPGNDWTGRAAAALRVAKHLEANESARLDREKRTLLHQAALNACDANDGVNDGVINNPLQCAFNPRVLQCSGRESDSCLTQPQVETAQMLYASPPNPATGRAITGLLPGSEMGWTDLGWTNSARATGIEQFRFLVYADPEWETARFDFDVDIAKAEADDQNTLNALNPNLKPFFDNGGKMIQYHGWADPQISPVNATQYYERVAESLGGRDNIHDGLRLFMVPGMGHCGGGPGANRFDMISALEAWVERDEAPASITAEHQTNGEIDMSRPLCPYPEAATYIGSGDTSDGANFECRSP